MKKVIGMENTYRLSKGEYLALLKKVHRKFTVVDTASWGVIVKFE